MPVQYVMTYLSPWHWKEWNKLPKAKQKKIREHVQDYIYTKLGKSKEEYERERRFTRESPTVKCSPRKK